MKRQLLTLMSFALTFCCRTSAAAKPHQEHIRARPLDLGNVRLLGGPLKQAQDIFEGKEKVTVRFQADEGDVVAAVFGIRMIGADAER